MMLVNKHQQKVQKYLLRAKIRLHHKIKQRLLLKIPNNKSEKKALDNTSTNQSDTSVSKQEVVKEAEEIKTQEVVQQPVIESTPVPVEPSYACLSGVDQN